MSRDSIREAIATEPDDLSQLLSLDEESVRDALKGRFEKDKIYTYTGQLRDRNAAPSPS